MIFEQKGTTFEKFSDLLREKREDFNTVQHLFEKYASKMAQLPLDCCFLCDLAATLGLLFYCFDYITCHS